MKELSHKAFIKSIDECILSQVDFILFAGDLFHTSLPSIDTLKIVTKKLKDLKDNNIPLYVIAGSHDFSPSNKSMIDVLESGGLLKNVCKGTVKEDKLNLKFTIDKKTGAKITGIIGRRGQLDKTFYENLKLDNLEQENGYKIFMFHTTITEMKPKELEFMDSQPISSLPKNFNYYAGGHIHNKTLINIPNFGTLTYTGSLFPTDFSELEKNKFGGYYLIEDKNIKWIPLKIIDHISIKLNCNNKTPEKIIEELLNYFINQDIKDKTISLRLFGTLEKGRVSDINFKLIFEKLYSLGAYFIMKNTSKLQSKDYQEIKIKNNNPLEIEEEIIKEHLGQLKNYDKETEINLTKNLLQSLNTTKKEGETNTDFQNRIIEESKSILNIKNNI